MLQRKDSNQPEQGLSKRSCVSTILLSVSLCHLICILSTIRLVMTATVQFNILFVLWGPIDFHSQYVMPSKPLPLYCPLNSQTVNVKASYSLLLFICSITTPMKVVIKLSNLLTLLLFFFPPNPRSPLLSYSGYTLQSSISTAFDNVLGLCLQLLSLQYQTSPQSSNCQITTLSSAHNRLHVILYRKKIDDTIL